MGPLTRRVEEFMVFSGDPITIIAAGGPVRKWSVSYLDSYRRNGVCGFFLLLLMGPHSDGVQLGGGINYAATAADVWVGGLWGVTLCHVCPKAMDSTTTTTTGPKSQAAL